MIGFAIRHPAKGYLTGAGGWSERGQGLFLFDSVNKAKKVAKKYEYSCVVSVVSIVEGETVWRQTKPRDSLKPESERKY